MEIVIFGASGGAIKVAQTFQNLNIDFSFFVDNDSNKWGNIVEKKEVRDPLVLKEKEYGIVIASDYQQEIEEQLQGMGVLNNLILKETLILEALNKHKTEFEEIRKFYGGNKNSKIVFELIDAGICLGGIESWTITLLREFKNRKINVELFSRRNDLPIPQNIEDITRVFDIDYMQYFQSVLELATELVKSLPCTLISNWQSQAMIAGIIVKEMFPNELRIVSVVHNDKIALYRRQKFFEPYTDKIMGVSQRINETFIKHYQIPREKIFYKESPVEFDIDFVKKYTLEDEKPLKIGFAARISKFQKRIDLLIKVIERLDENNINYNLEIAGEGSYFSKLKLWHTNYKYKEKIEILGRVSRDRMNQFWKNKDIYLSVSDFEGASISMLEAMSYGIIPVVTSVSGVEEYVQNEWNGLIANTGDVTQLSKYIAYISQKRELLPIFGQRSRKIIKDKCKLSEYCDKILSEINQLQSKV